MTYRRCYLRVKQFEIVRGRDASGTHLEQALELDAMVYEKRYRGVYDNCMSWFIKNPDIYVFIVDKETLSVVAYANIMPVSNKLYSEVRSSQVKDVYISASDIQGYEDGSAYSLLLCSLVVHPEYQATTAFSLLYDAIMQQFMGLLSRGVFIERVISEGVSEKGARVCRLSGFKMHRINKFGNAVYELEDVFEKFRPLSSSAEQLKELYKKSID